MIAVAQRFSCKNPWPSGSFKGHFANLGQSIMSTVNKHKDQSALAKTSQRLIATCRLTVSVDHLGRVRSP